MSKVTFQRPREGEFLPYYGQYIALVPDGDLVKLLARQMRGTLKTLRAISEKKSLYRYAPDKWSIREVIGHIADSERVFTHRALRFARNDVTPLPGFDEKQWGAQSSAHSRTMKSLLNDLEALRAATVTLLGGFSQEEIGRSGTANNAPVTVRALAWIIAGHETHHMNILKERYLNS